MFCDQSALNVVGLFYGLHLNIEDTFTFVLTKLTRSSPSTHTCPSASMNICSDLLLTIYEHNLSIPEHF